MQKEYRESYREFLQSPYWKEFRREVIEYYGSKCFVCGLDYKQESRKIHVHHFKYKKWGISIVGIEHKFWDVCLLCEEHHLRGEMSRWFLLWFKREYEHFQKSGSFSRGWKFVRVLARWNLL